MRNTEPMRVACAAEKASSRRVGCMDTLSFLAAPIFCMVDILWAFVGLAGSLKRQDIRRGHIPLTDAWSPQDVNHSCIHSSTILCPFHAKAMNHLVVRGSFAIILTSTSTEFATLKPFVVFVPLFRFSEGWPSSC